MRIFIQLEIFYNFTWYGINRVITDYRSRSGNCLITWGEGYVNWIWKGYLGNLYKLVYIHIYYLK